MPVFIFGCLEVMSEYVKGPLMLNSSTLKLLWRRGYGVGHISKVMLRRAQLYWDWWPPLAGVLSMQVFVQATQPGHPSVGGCSENRRWFRPTLGKKRRVLRSSGPATGLLPPGLSRLKAMAVSSSRPSSRHQLYANLIGSNPRQLKFDRAMSSLALDFTVFVGADSCVDWGHVAPTFWSRWDVLCFVPHN